MHLWKGCVRVCQQVEDNMVHLINYHRPGFKNQLMFQDVTG